MLTDTHAHLDYPDFAGDFDAVLARAQEAGVRRVITIGTSIDSSRRVLELARLHDGVHAVVGIHPTDLRDADTADVRPALRELAAASSVVAIGETGLDYHRLPEDLMEAQKVKERQATLFRQQLDLAAELNLNVVIHQRDAWEDTLAILSPYTGRLRGVFHCFGGTPEQAAEAAAMGHLVSFTGIVTFKNAGGVRQSAASVAADGFMVETDCPYLAPVPHRGGRCEPWHARLVAECIAEVRETDLGSVAARTERVAEEFFRFH